MSRSTKNGFWIVVRLTDDQSFEFNLKIFGDFKFSVATSLRDEPNIFLHGNASEISWKILKWLIARCLDLIHDILFEILYLYYFNIVYLKLFNKMLAL